MDDLDGVTEGVLPGVPVTEGVLRVGDGSAVEVGLGVDTVFFVGAGVLVGSGVGDVLGVRTIVFFGSAVFGGAGVLGLRVMLTVCGVFLTAAGVADGAPPPPPARSPSPARNRILCTPTRLTLGIG